MHWNENNLKKAALLARYLQNGLSEDETAELREWLKEDPANGLFLRRLEESKEESMAFLASLDEDKAWDALHARITPEASPAPVPILRRLLVAAAVLLIIGYVFYQYPGKIKTQTEVPAKVATTTDFAPGTDKAFLTLDDGSVLILEDLPEGQVKEEAGVTLTKQKDELSYAPYIGPGDDKPAFNQLSTPAGGYYRLVLPDSSLVWLNAASSIRFPVRFGEKERRVQITGEAFFDITSRYTTAGTKKSFIIETEKGNIEVLGTQFNVLAYPDEPVLKTTLLEGSVKVTSPDNISKTLRPGQQAILGDQFQVRTADTDEATAWKNGYFQFENRPLNEILRQLQRWYGVKIDESTVPSGKHFTCSVSRDKSLSGVLKMLELSGDLHFEIVEQKIRITEKKN